MISTSRIIIYYMSALIAFQFVCISLGPSPSFSPAAVVCSGCLRGAAQSNSEENTNNCAEVCFLTALPLPSWVLDRDGGQKAGRQQSRGNGRVIERTAPLPPNAL